MTLVVATYNIHGCVGLDRRADHARIVRVLQGLDADVIALQEVDSYMHRGSWRRHLEYFAQHTGMQAVAGPTLMRETGEYGNAILTRLPILSTRRIEISVLDHEPRGVLETDLSLGDDVLRVIATHLGLGATERDLQLDSITDLIREAGSHPVVVLGDFNEWRRGALRPLDEAMGRSRAVRTYPSLMPILPLDRIWVRPAEALRALDVVRGHGARFASDHLPVRAVLEL